MNLSDQQFRIRNFNYNTYLRHNYSMVYVNEHLMREQ